MIETTQIKPATHFPAASSSVFLSLMSLGLEDIMRSSWLSWTRFPMVFVLETIKKINKNMTNQIVMEEIVVIYVIQQLAIAKIDNKQNLTYSMSQFIIQSRDCTNRFNRRFVQLLRKLKFGSVHCAQSADFGSTDEYIILQLHIYVVIVS